MNSLSLVPPVPPLPPPLQLFLLFGEGFITTTGTLKDYDSTARLRELRPPVLFTAGQYDDSRPAENAWYQSFVPGARLEIIENAAHLVMLDNSKRYAEVVRRFLRDVEGSK